VIWDFDDSSTSLFENPMHEFESPGIYNVMLTVSDTNLCVDSIVHKIIMYYDYVLYVPNTFTPNGDGENDKFGPIGLRMEKYESYQFIIYNRWGEQVFFTELVSEKWDGIDTQSGIYNWVVILKDELGEIRKETGKVMLIK
jgi:gliding motility-associated-like protein